MTPRERQWELVLQKANTLVLAMAQHASQNPTLRALYPFYSLNNLRFSRRDGYPEDFDLPYIAFTPLGEYQARTGENEVMLVGALPDVVARVAELVAEKLRPS